MSWTIKDTGELTMEKNKAKEYPVLDNQQLLSLIRANTLIAEDMAKRINVLESFKAMNPK